MQACMRRSRPVISIFALLVFVLFAVPAHADRMALWKIVSQQCMPHFEKGEAPLPCERIETGGGGDSGYAYLKDIVGIAQMLTIPVRRLTGIEDPALLAPDAPDYFADAWEAKRFVEMHLGRELPREAVVIAINSQYARSQDQMHLHVDCVDKDVAAALASHSGGWDDHFGAMTIELKGRRYWARRLDSEDLSGVSPFQLLAREIDGARAEMGQWSLAAIGANLSGRPGFILLADRRESGRGGHAEDLQDHDCLIKGPKT